MSVFNTANKADHTKVTAFLDPTGGPTIQRYDTLKYKSFDSLTDKQLGFFWRPEEVNEYLRSKNENTRQEFRDAFHRYATQNNMYGHGLDSGQNQDESQGSLNIVFDFDPENTEHKEVLFKMSKYVDRLN